MPTSDPAGSALPSAHPNKYLLCIFFFSAEGNPMLKQDSGTAMESSHAFIRKHQPMREATVHLRDVASQTS